MVVKGFIHPGRTKVFWVVTLTAPAAPSAAEINAGTEITAGLRGTPDYTRTGNVVDDAALDSDVDLQALGTKTLGAPTMTMKRTLATETEYNALAEGDSGFLVVLRKGTAGASPASGDEADVLTVDVNVKGPVVPARNDVDTSTVEMINTAEMNLDKIVAA